MKTAQKYILYAIALYHVFLGIMAFISGSLTYKIAESIFGMQLMENHQMAYLGKLLGIYALIFGVFVFYVALDTKKYQKLIKVILLLYVLRILNRVIFLSLAKEAFSVSTSRIWIDAGLLLAFGAGLYVTTYFQKKN